MLRTDLVSEELGKVYTKHLPVQADPILCCLCSEADNYFLKINQFKCSSELEKPLCVYFRF